MQNPKFKKRYLGDGVYINHDGYHFVLTTEYGDGIPTNTIKLDAETATALWQTLNQLIQPETQ